MPNGDPETEALAQELGVETAEPPKPDATPKAPPKGDETPKTEDTKGARPPEGEKKGDGERDDGGTPPDPLADFAKDPDTAVKGLLKHPVLGPILNRWADTAARHQVDAARREPRGPSEAEIRDKLQVEKEDDFFSKITPEQLKEELAHPEDGAKAAAAYGRYQQRLQEKAKGPTPEQRDYDIQAAAVRSLVATYRSMVDDSDLSDEVKAELQPESFTKHGKDSLVVWGKAIYDAHIAHGIEQKWESVKEERLAELDKNRPGSGGGRPPGSMPDLMATDSSVGLEQALDAEAQKKK